MPAFHPKRGMVPICDFGGFRRPGMTKKRPVLVVGEEGTGRVGTCVVVPLGSVAPDPVMGYHHRLDPTSLPTGRRRSRSWAKCDMLTTVSCERLDRVLNGRDALGRRYCVTHRVSRADLAAIQRDILVAPHMSALALHVVDSADVDGA